MLVLSAVALVPGCTRGSGVKATEARTMETFEGIDVGGPFNVDVQVGPATTVTVTGDDNVVPLVVTEVRQGTLHVELGGRVATKLPLRVSIASPTITEVDAAGASRVSVKGVTGEELEVDASGASEVRLEGAVEALDADVSGASVLKASALTATRGEVDASGASSATVHVTSALDAEASGASRIQYSGSPGEVSRDASGSSTIKAR